MTDVSIIVPMHNAGAFLKECLTSIVSQDFKGTLQLSVFEDACTDDSKEILSHFLPRLNDRNIHFVLSSNTDSPKGVGYAKNRAVEQSSGVYLCFLDADDVMHKSRITKQYEANNSEDNCIVGSQFHRKPSDSTPRYVDWANRLSTSQLYLQIYTSFGPTLIMPTWFCHRKVFDRVGGFGERGKGIPEDLLFFYEHLRLGGHLKQVKEDLLMYRYHPSATTFSITEETLWKLRLSELERTVLSQWNFFTIWNAGKQGRKFFRSLSFHSRSKVIAFCDVDIKKLSKGVYIYEESDITPKPRVPIVHFKEAKAPFILCVKIAMTEGEFEKNLASLHLTEGQDYYHFS